MHPTHPNEPRYEPVDPLAARRRVNQAYRQLLQALRDAGMSSAVVCSEEDIHTDTNSSYPSGRF